MIDVKNLTKTYDNGENQLYALNKVSFTIADNDFVVILGPSGSGKTTLMNCLSGLLKPDDGKIMYDNEDLTALFNKGESKALVKFRKDKLAFIFQQYYLLPTINVRANIRMGADLMGNRKFDDIISALGLEGLENRMPYQLSGGQQQRVAIARALAKKPEVLFLDEPTGALDEQTGRQILKYLENIQRESRFTMIMVTHNENIADMATKIIRMNSGKIKSIVENNPVSADEIGW